jgi:hypothetical protein
MRRSRTNLITDREDRTTKVFFDKIQDRTCEEYKIAQGIER